MRKLASIRRILALNPIEGADAIELATVDGWKVVVKKGEFASGELCVYFEIDSFLPVVPMFEFLRKSSFRKMGELEGFRLRTIKLRGQVSQGLVIPIPHELEVEWLHTFFNFADARPLREGDDVTELLGVKKYEPPVPVELAGQIRGNFPGFIKKTDQERCQNLVDEIFVVNKDARYEVTMKMDGTSFTGFYVDGEEGVCGRNWELKLDESNATNTLVRTHIDSKLMEVLRKYGKNYAVQAELMGPGIQKNREALKAPGLFVFDIYDIDGSGYVAPEGRHQILQDLQELGLDVSIVRHAPVMHLNVTLAELGITNLAELLAFAEGPSLVHPIREGLVFKRMDGGFSFKTISNKFLLKEED